MSSSNESQEQPVVFSTIKVRDNVRRWVKAQAAIRGVHMYQMIEQLFSESPEGRGRPWEDTPG